MTMNSEHEPGWRKSHLCGTSSCVEVAKVGDTYLLRDSKDPAAAPLAVGEQDWHAFTVGVLAGDFG